MAGGDATKKGYHGKKMMEKQGKSKKTPTTHRKKGK